MQCSVQHSTSSASTALVRWLAIKLQSCSRPPAIVAHWSACYSVAGGYVLARSNNLTWGVNASSALQAHIVDVFRVCVLQGSPEVLLQQ